jgi:hypothetical protein
MNKFSLLLAFTFFLISVNRTYGQNEYYDAIKLRKLLNSNGVWTDLDPDVSKILNKYLDANETIRGELLPNPFLDDYLAAWVSSGRSGLTDLSSIADLGNLNITNLADGFAKFLVKRTKQELNAAFFSKFEELIKKPEYRDAQLLFPQTYSVLSAISTQIYNYESYLNVLRESFEKDLNNLLPNMKRVVEDGRYASFFSSHPELKAICLSAIFIGQEFQRKVHPGEIIRDFPTDEYLSSRTLVNAKASVETLQLFSEAVRSKDNSRYWINADSLKLIFEETTFNIFLGLLYESGEEIAFDNALLPEIMDQASNTADEAIVFKQQMETFFRELQARTEMVVISVRSLKEKAPDKHEFSDYYGVYSATIDVIEHIVDLNRITGFDMLPDNLEDLQLKIPALRSGGEIAFDLSNRNFSSAIINLYTLYAATIQDPSSGPIKPFILKYGSFMAAVAQAENSDEVAAAIETIVLPSGSSRIKRETVFNVSLNSYVGLFTGYEKIKGIDNEFKVNSYGVTAPIGLSINLGKQRMFPIPSMKKFEGHWSWTAFMSIVDLGAVTAFRFENDSTETIPTVQLKDIISPGIILSLGIPKSPLSINLGYQTGPILRRITATAKHEENYSRLSLSLCVDIPLLNFYTYSGKN